MQKYAAIGIENSVKNFDKIYEYIIPSNFNNIIPGVRVMVPFGQKDKLRQGIVLNVKNDTSFDNLKVINIVLDDFPIINELQIHLIKWMAKRYICTYWQSFQCMIPNGIGIKANYYYEVTENLDLSTLTEAELKNLELIKSDDFDYNENKDIVNRLLKNKYIIRRSKLLQKIGEKNQKYISLNLTELELNEVLSDNSIRFAKQRRVLEILAENEDLPVSDVLMFSNASRSSIKTLEKKEFIKVYTKKVERIPIEIQNTINMNNQKEIVLSNEQEVALERLTNASNEEIFKEFLLHGITGSGKTEVYIRISKHVISQGKNVIILVPEISLTTQITERFTSVFNNQVAIIHSRLSLGEKKDQWDKIRQDKANVIIGARSAIFVPVKNIGLIIIDEEHDSSYKSEITPKYDARHIAYIMSKKSNSVLIYGSATPSVEIFNRTILNDLEKIELKKRPTKFKLPEIEVLNMREEKKSHPYFCDKLIEHLKNNYINGYQTIIFVNRRGHSSNLLCTECGNTFKCPHCSVAMTYHKTDNRIYCHYCGYTLTNPNECYKCHSKKIIYNGIGTQKVEQIIKNMLPEAPLYRMDTDTTRRKNSHNKIITSFRNSKAGILIGTQMISKGHDFPNVSLVCILSADSIINSSDYKASEKAFQLLTQTSGRAGRGNVAGKVLIQAFDCDNYCITTAIKHDYNKFFQQEILLRKTLKYLPFYYIGFVLVSSTNEELVNTIINKIYEYINNKKIKKYSKSEIFIYKPAKPLIYKLKKKYRWRIIIKCKEIQIINDLLTDTKISFAKYKDISLTTDINPGSLL